MSWRPFRETEGINESSPTPGTGCGDSPRTDTRHKDSEPPRVEEKTRSRPSGVQLGGVTIEALSNVRRFGVPPTTGTRYKSSETPAAVPRIKAMAEPSGEKAGA